ncbi:MAG: MATE family efflux transporter [Clostridia bacterium]|nr:MATE family efflux transporter [Clostridia bacterium]
MRRNVDMVNGSLSKNLVRFVIPMILTGVLQLMFNACDLVVVGQFAGDRALAAVGATGALINLLVNAFIGLSTGVNIIAAHAYGARDHEKIDKIIHTAVFLAVVCGVVVAVVGIGLSKPCLLAMNTPEDTLDLAVLYMRIYFLGAPASVLYNFCAAILRAQGNSKHPLMFLTVAGVVNVVLNLFFVLVFHMSVLGVALATAISQVVSAVLVVLYLKNPADPNALKFKKLKMEKAMVGQIFRLGVPASVGGMVFSFANIQVQSAVNTFGSAAMAGCSAAANLEGFIYTAMHGVSQGALSFVGQNVGAKKLDRVPKVARVASFYAGGVGLVLGIIIYIFKTPLLSLYLSDAESMVSGYSRMNMISMTYWICGIMEVYSYAMRGMGSSTPPTINSMLGACGLRILWLQTIFKLPAMHTLEGIFLTFPVSWVVTTTANFIGYKIILGKRKKEALQLASANEKTLTE